MKVFYCPGSERLLDVLTSAVWHYRRYIDELINSGPWENIDSFLEERKLIDMVLQTAVDKPVPGSNFAVRCQDGREFLLVRQVLEHYLSESIAVLNCINEHMIAEKCREDIEIIRRYLMQAVH
ncbi:hypothetical protein [Phosphitispora sp. TUW77]|uniref:hypothetical protein n=1 Tax=Phosphitispora sp. TUW77 TaxID=3152361 RepID=UPI003AB7713B